MIKLYDSEIIDILPSHFRNDPDVQAMSYALKKMNQKILDYTKKIGVYCAIENLDEAILDLLATELRTHYYDMTLPVKISARILHHCLTKIWRLSVFTRVWQTFTVQSTCLQTELLKRMV